MKKTLLYLALVSLPCWWACRQLPAEDHDVTQVEIVSVADAIDSTAPEGGLALLKQNCYVCHNPAAPSHDEIVAPPLVAAKWRYSQSYSERAAFIENMTAYVHQPAADKALMRGPVRRFGVMPPTTLSEDTIRSIVTYIYDNELEAPDWFAGHFEEEHGASWKQ
ncbi:MAG: c-type cytochrome [Saprospiraceae bacterium]|nr:c-type cytochrome [Lewinella sp.]